jgi:hypothetical protein
MTEHSAGQHWQESRLPAEIIDVEGWRVHLS